MSISLSASASSHSETSKRSPFPIPFGWFQIGWPSDVAAGETKPLYYFGRHLVLWRDERGEVHLQDAFCPHLGAHLGHGGKVLDCEIACPFDAITMGNDFELADYERSDLIFTKEMLLAEPIERTPLRGEGE